MRSTCIIVTIILLTTNSFAQKSGYIKEENGIDSNTIKLVNSYNDSGFNLRNNQPTISHQYLLKALKLAEFSNYPFGIATALKHIGFYHRYRWNLPEALDTTEKSLQYFKALNLPVGILECNYNRSVVLSYMGDKFNAIKLCLESIRQARHLNNPKFVIMNYVQLGNIYSSVRETDTARKYLYIALEIAGQNAKDGKSDSFRAYQALGEVAEQVGDWNEALKWYNAGLVHSLKDNKPHFILFIANHLNIANVRCELEQYSEVVTIVDSVKNVIKSNSDFKGYLAWADYILAKTYLRLGDFNNARKFALLCVSEKPNMGPFDYSIEVKQFLASIYAMNQQYDSAFYYERSYMHFKDTVNDINVIKKWISASLQDQNIIQATSLKTQKSLINAQSQSIATQRKLNFALTGGAIILALFLYLIFRNNKKINRLISNVLPQSIVREWKKYNTVKPKEIKHATIMFTDFVKFTEQSKSMTADELISTLDEYFTSFDSIVGKYNIEKIKTIGDAYMAAGGLPIQNNTNTSDVINTAKEILASVEEINARRMVEGKKYFEIRIGVNTGEVIAGITGTKKFAYDIWGMDVNLANRVESKGRVGKINISEKLYYLIKDRYTCAKSDIVDAKGFGLIQLYTVEE